MGIKKTLNTFMKCYLVAEHPVALRKMVLLSKKQIRTETNTITRLYYSNLRYIYLYYFVIHGVVYQILSQQTPKWLLKSYLSLSGVLLANFNIGCSAHIICKTSKYLPFILSLYVHLVHLTRTWVISHDSTDCCGAFHSGLIASDDCVISHSLSTNHF